jgi:hypothetical protein
MKLELPSNRTLRTSSSGGQANQLCRCNHRLELARSRPVQEQGSKPELAQGSKPELAQGNRTSVRGA